jgi:hypothetical protein
MIVGQCTAHGCNVLTIGPRCVDHDVPVTRTFTRGRPFRPAGERGTEPASRAAPPPAANMHAPVLAAGAPVTAS